MTTQNKKKVEAIEAKTSGGGDIVEDFIEDVWKVMTPEMADRLKYILIDDMGFTKQDADQFIQSQRNIRRKRICLKKDKRDVKIGPRNQWIKELSKDIADQMAMFVVGILLSNRSDRTKRLTEQILAHLCDVTGEDTTPETAKTRVEKTMVVVADRMATWIDENISDIDKKMKEKYKTLEPLEAEPKESIITLISVMTESTDSVPESIAVSEDFYSGSEVSEIKSEITSSIRSSDSLEEKALEDTEETSEEEKEENELESKDSEKEDSQEEESEGKEYTKEKSDVEETEKEESDVQDTEKDESEENKQTTAEESDLDNEEKEKAEESDVKDSRKIVKLVEDEDTEYKETDEERDEREKKQDKVEEAKKSLIKETKLDEDKDEMIEEDKESDIKKRISEKISEDSKKLPVDILDLLKEDVTRLQKEGEKSDRQKAVKEVIDKRFEEIVKEKLQKSLDSLIKFNIDEAASIVADWVDNILASADVLPRTLSDTKSAFEIKLGDRSEYAILRLSSTTVAERIAVTKGLDPPIRKKKLPRSMSPMNEKSTKDWAVWALGAVNVGEEWGKWLDKVLSDAEQRLMGDIEPKPDLEKAETWKDWKNAKEKEAEKWRAEQQRIKNEGSLWNRKLNTNVQSAEQEKEAEKWRAEQQRIKNEGSLWNRKLNTNVQSAEQEKEVINYYK